MSTERTEVAAELLRVLESAFPGDAVLPAAVTLWVGYEDSTAPACAVCRRPFGANAVISWATRIHLVRGTHAGKEPAACGDCLNAAKAAFAAVVEAPSWEMQLAQLERALALIPEDSAAIARECLALRPQTVTDGRCLLCEKATSIARGHAAGLCSSCASEGRRVLEDLGTRREVDSSSTRCPKCGSHEIASGIVGIEFTEMTCLSCSHSEICDVWQLDDWR